MKIDVDNHKLMYHPERIAQWLKEGDCFPIYVEIGPTNACNHNCIFCALDFLDHNIDYIDARIMIKTLDDMAACGVKSVMFSGEGEPLLHKDIGQFLQHAKDSGLDVALTTNGVLFDKEKIEDSLADLCWIRFSVDSGSRENYAEIHRTDPGDFDKVMENIIETVRLRDSNGFKTTIGVQFLLMPQNVNEAIKLAKVCRDAGVDNLQIKPYSHHPKSLNKFVIDYEKYAYLEAELERFDSDRFRVLFRSKTMQRLQQGFDYPECYGLPFFALITAKGDIIPCNLFYDNPEFTYGNLYRNSFSEIWRSDRRKGALKKLHEINTAECRKSCRLDPVNRYLHRLKNYHPHDSFI